MKKVSLVLVLALVLSVSVQAAVTDPGDIGGLTVRLEADSLGLADGAAVTSWTDSASGYEFTGTATYDADYANGHAGVYFDGIGDQLRNMGWTNGPSPDNVTLFVVGNFTTTGNDGNADWMISAQWPSGSTNNRFRLIKYKQDSTHPGGQYQFRVGSASTFTSPTDVLTDTDRHIFTLLSSPTGANGLVELFVDSDLLGSGESGSVVPMEALGLGSNLRGGTNNEGNNFGDCSIAEVLLYDHALTAEQVSDVNAYLAEKYAVPEPATMALLGLGGLLGLKRKK